MLGQSIIDFRSSLSFAPKKLFALLCRTTCTRVKKLSSYVIIVQHFHIKAMVHLLFRAVCRFDDHDDDDDDDDDDDVPLTKIYIISYNSYPVYYLLEKQIE